MRKIIILSFITLDGVLQAPGGPQEDTSGNFKYGGWSAPYSDEFSGKLMIKQLSKPFDLLLGRKTYEIFSSFWPNHNEGIIGKSLNNATKYVASNTLENPIWNKTIILKGDVIKQIKELKKQTVRIYKCTEAVTLFKLY